MSSRLDAENVHPEQGLELHLHIEQEIRKQVNLHCLKFYKGLVVKLKQDFPIQERLIDYYERKVERIQRMVGTPVDFRGAFGPNPPRRL